ncbi:MAG: amino acid racemase [Nitriliruptoraceae bacterium]
MRTLGLLGGMAWPSTLDAYRWINQEIGRRLGGVHSARLLLWSADFAEIERLQARGEWEAAGALLADAGQRLERAGAEGLVLCTNTMHKVAPTIEAATTIPLLHIADATADAVVADGVSRVLLLGTRFTMEEPFLLDRLRGRGLDVLVPDAADRKTVHDVIYTELVHGHIEDASREVYRAVVQRALARGATGVIAGCTEIELLLRPEDVTVRYYPTMRLHASAAAAWMVADEPGGPAGRRLGPG